jgi:peptidoglycan/LPS O-acetylase OafA/YrhL
VQSSLPWHFSAPLAFSAAGGDHELSWLDLAASLGLGLCFLPSPLYGASGWKLFPLNDPAWSLLLELLANAAMAVHWKRLTNRALTWICLVSGALLIRAALGLGQAGEGFRWISVSMGLLRVSYSFFAGILIYRLRDRLNLSLHPAVALGLVAVALLGTPSDQWRAVYDLGWILVGLPAIIAVAASREPAGGASVYRFLGVTSYGVYVLHYPIQRLTLMAITALGGDVGAFAPWSGLAFVGVLLAACAWLDRVYDQPLRRWLTGITRRRSATADGALLPAPPS